MVPILALAGAAVLVILVKWVSLMLVRMPNRSQVDRLLTALGRGEREEVDEAAKALSGPVGVMLSAGAAQLDAPKDLIEEVMFEKLLETRSRLQRALPFIAVSAASAPLLGLLGTVTGIINTFKLLTVFGSGDVKMLSGGISEALITTEFGLIVAIPTLLSHAFLSRRAKAVADRMEQLAIAFMTELEKARAAGVMTAVLPAPEAPPARQRPPLVPGGRARKNRVGERPGPPGANGAQADHTGRPLTGGGASQ
jgi:biopolymer transport protein ExbB